jgi:hypothetical protein
MAWHGMVMCWATCDNLCLLLNSEVCPGEIGVHVLLVQRQDLVQAGACMVSGQFGRHVTLLDPHTDRHCLESHRRMHACILCD